MWSMTGFIWLALPILLSLLFPCRIDRFADQRRRIGAGARPELLEAAGIDFSNVDVSFLVRAHAMHAPERAWKIGDRSPRVEEMAVEIVLKHLVGVAIEGHQRPIRANLHEVQARGTYADFPL